MCEIGNPTLVEQRILTKIDKEKGRKSHRESDEATERVENLPRTRRRP